MQSFAFDAQTMYMDDPLNNISPGLFLGSIWASEDLHLLKENKITHILIVGNNLKKNYPEEFTYHQIEVRDVEYEDMISHFSVCIDFIEKALMTGNVLVHCAAGVSRSSTIVIAYLMQKNKWDMETAFKYTRQKRNTVLPNVNFRKQLELYHKLDYIVDSKHPDIVVLKQELQSKKKPFTNYQKK